MDNNNDDLSALSSDSPMVMDVPESHVEERRVELPENPNPVLGVPREDKTTVQLSTYDRIRSARQKLDSYGIDVSKLSDQEVLQKVEKIQGIINEKVQVLSRGQVLANIHRLLAYVPSGYIGQFVRETDLDISTYQALGFRILIDEKANQDSMTSTGDGKIRLGDQILMITPEENYVAIRVVREQNRESRKVSRTTKGQLAEGRNLEVPIFELP